MQPISSDWLLEFGMYWFTAHQAKESVMVRQGGEVRCSCEIRCSCTALGYFAAGCSAIGACTPAL